MITCRHIYMLIPLYLFPERSRRDAAFGRPSPTPPRSTAGRGGAGQAQAVIQAGIYE